MKHHQRGFTLVEIMVVVAIVGILTVIAVPSYKDYITRARLSEAFTSLAGVQPQAEQFWTNNRTYVGFDRMPANTTNFTYALTNATTSTYTVTATGTGTMAGFTFSLDQSGARATGATAWGPTSTACWIDNKAGTCTQ